MKRKNTEYISNIVWGVWLPCQNSFPNFRRRVKSTVSICIDQVYCMRTCCNSVGVGGSGEPGTGRVCKLHRRITLEAWEANTLLGSIPGVVIHQSRPEACEFAFLSRVSRVVQKRRKFRPICYSDVSNTLQSFPAPASTSPKWPCQVGAPGVQGR